MTANEFVVDFPVLWVTCDWIEQHCVIPDGFRKGEPFQMYDWQLWCTANHYRIKSTAATGQLAPAFHYRRSQVVAPQKALALDTPIVTPTGWTTMGALQPGDTVFDEQGQPTRVLSKSPVWHSDTYRVTFSDGASLLACADHQWWVERRNRSGRYIPCRVSTRDLLGGLTDKEGARIYRVPVAGALQLPDADLPIDPYTLGAWLGDGHRDDGRLTGLDREVFDRIAEAGYEIRQNNIAKRVQAIGLKTHLRAAGLLLNKHIPAAYLRASEAQRWALLQGLMDTDGHADERQGKCELVTTIPGLLDGFRELLYSLGIRHTVYEGRARLYGRDTGPKWRVFFSARADMPVFGLERKQARLRPAGRGHAQFRHRRIVEVRQVPTVPTQCLTVEAPSHVFLAGREMIPTCNTGKGPWTASICAAEAVGPAVFNGWAAGGEVYDCRDWDCGCGWSYEYEPGEPMARPWPTPLVQITAFSEEQTDNVYRPLQSMIRNGPLGELMKVGEQFIRLPGDGRIDVVTSSAQSRLGNPVTFVLQDETQLWTVGNKMTRVAETQRRGAAGMGGRTMETTNAWDPSENSVAQRTAEAKVKDIFRFHRKPPPELKYELKADRRKIHRHVYSGSTHVDLDAIEAEAAELADVDPAQAERFFGNRITAGTGTWLPRDRWDARASYRDVPDGTPIVLGFDGSDIDDWTGIRAETTDGYQFTPVYSSLALPTVWDPKEWGGQVPRLEVDAALDELMRRYQVVRMYCDPPYWPTEVDAWAEKYGDKRVFKWNTNQVIRMHAACERLVTDVTKADSTFFHDGCEDTSAHVGHARRAARPADRYVLRKAAPHQKIDLAVVSVLAHEAASDAIAAGLARPKTPRRTTVMR